MTYSARPIPTLALRFLEEGEQLSIATVVQTWGSAPRAPGSQLLITSSGHMEGSISGGCVESAVLHYGLDAIKTGKCQLHEFGVSDETAFSVGLSCGGTIKVLVEPVDVGKGIPKTILTQLSELILNNEQCFLVTNLSSFERSVYSRASLQEALGLSLDSKEKNDHRNEESFVSDNLFVNAFSLPARLIIIGAVHIAQALVEIAKILGFETVIIDPREVFAASSRFTGVTLLNDWPDEIIARLAPDNSTAIVFLTHDPKIDDPGLKIALDSNAFYIGCLGSKETHKKRSERLLKMEISKTDIERIHAPVGLNIGARTPSEIALSIMSEMVLKMRKIKVKDSQTLSDSS